MILFLSIFPLVASLTLSVTNLVFQKGRIDLTFVGLSNYTSLLFGTERSHFLGALRGPSPLGWAIVAVAALLLGRLFISTVRGRRLSPFGVGLRLVASVLAVGFVYLFVQTLFSDECIYFVLEMLTSRMAKTWVKSKRLHPTIKGLETLLSHFAQYTLAAQYCTTLSRGIQVSRNAQSLLIVAFSIGKAVLDAEHIT